MSETTLSLFQGYGIEIEYMIVDAETLDVKPIADEVLRALAAGEAGVTADTPYESEVEAGALAWSNELALHVLEVKTNGPVATLEGLATEIQRQLCAVDRILRPRGARLLPGAMHPWMRPDDEMRLWPHGDETIYSAFDRIFDCRGHGWANPQSMHINLPFSGDDEFGRLHAAIRLVLPILPALAASSPIMDARVTGAMDNRLNVYRDNARRVPSVSGIVIPEQVFTRADYENVLLAGIYNDLAPHDPDGILRHEWVNARGCIARFDRMALEIRVLDTQECAQADVAIAELVTGVVRALVEEQWCDVRAQQGWAAADLAALLTQCIDQGDDARLSSRAYLACFGMAREEVRAADLWRHLLETVSARGALNAAARESLEVIINEGPLARRIVRAAGTAPVRQRLSNIYGQLANCLSEGVMFRPGESAREGEGGA